MTIVATLPEAPVVSKPEAPPLPQEAPEVDPGPQLPYMSPTVGKLFAALSKAQGAMRAAIKGSVNPHYKSKFADLDAVWEAIRGPLSDHGLCVTQVMLPTARGTVLVAILGHESGEWIRSEVPVKPEKPGIHAIASAIQYFRRYTLGPLVGVTSSEDDDGNEAARK
jgi:ERF superfamily